MIEKYIYDTMEKARNNCLYFLMNEACQSRDQKKSKKIREIYHDVLIYNFNADWYNKLAEQEDLAEGS